MRGTLIGVALVAVLSACSVAQAAYPGFNGPLVFQSSRDGDNEIYLLNADGSGITKLTDNAVGDVNPVWSPDGTKIAFQSNSGGDVDVWVMNADGSGQVPLTDDPAFDGEPTWSPDGTGIAFTSDRDGDREIFKMNADGSNQVQLTADTVTDEQPAWGSSADCIPPCAPTGLLAFTTNRDGNDEIYLMGEDGTGLSNLTQNPATDQEPNWRFAGDARTIAFSTDRGSPPGDQDFDVWDVDLSHIAGPVVDGPADETAPAWSPDGLRMAYERDNGNREIYVTNPSVNVTNALTNERAPDWKPEPAPPGGPPGSYARPRGATPFRASLAPAFAPCAEPNRTHGPPLAFSSCNPPTAISPNITVGSPDSMDSAGGSANAVMSVRLDAIVGSPGPPSDSDVRVVASFTDIRCRADLPTCGAANATGTRDYTGQLSVELPFQITDQWNASVPGGGTDRATGQMTLAAPANCQSTANTNIGATCTVTTSVSALAGAAALPDGRRTIMELGPLLARDGGPDGVASTADNAVFAKQAIYVP